MTDPASDPDQITETAKRTFRLADRLAGVRYATAKVVLFTDPAAAAEYAQAQDLLQQVAGVIAGIDLDKAEDHEHLLLLTEQRDGLQAEYDKLEAAAAEDEGTMLSSALAVHMRTVPQVVIDRAARHARKAYALNDGTIPDDSRDAFFEMQNAEVIGQCISRIVDSTGAEADFDRATIADDLRASLPHPQWERLLRAWNTLVFNDALARQATADPGF